MNLKDFNAIRAAMAAHLASRGIEECNLEAHELWRELDAMVAGIEAYKTALGAA